MNKSLKKVFSTFVSLTTIVWSVGLGTLAMPGVASAASISTGDLIKASGPAVYYYASDAKRYVFPNEKTYFAWYNDFSGVKTITDTELAAIAIGGNVTVRPGTKLVKITTDPKVYAVTKCGTLHWIESETVAKALYGDAWATRVIDVPDSFFVNYTVGSSISTNVHPDGTLIAYTGDTANYVVWSGVKRKFMPDTAFAANGFNPLNVITTTLTYGNGSDVTGREAELADTVCAGTAPVGGNLTVALASDTPAGMTVPKNSSSVPLVKVNLMAGSGDVLVTGLRFHRVGVGAVADFANVYLYDQDGVRLTTGRSINSSTNIVEFNALNMTVPAGGMRSVYVYGDFSSPASTGGQHAFQILDAASVIVSSGTVAGSFPVRGNVFTVGTTAAARVDVAKGSTPANPTIGAKEAEISNFKITANTNDVSVSQVTLYQAGSITNSDLTNFKLYQGTTMVASASAVSANGRIVLKFSPAYTIANGTTRVFSLKADVAGRAGRTIRTYVEYTTDVSAMDTMYSAGAAVCINNTATGCGGSTANFDGTSAGPNYIEVTTQGGQLSNSFNGPVTANIAKGQQGVKLYTFALTSPDNTLEVRNLRFQLENVSGGACRLQGSVNATNYFRNIKVVNLDSNQTWMGPKEIAGNATPQPLIFADSQNLAAGQTINLAVVADLSSSQDVGGEFFDCTYRVTFNPFQDNDIRVTDTGEYLDITKIVPNQVVNGNNMTVKSSRLSVGLASNPSSDTLVKKQQNVPVAGIVLTASSESDITITNLTLAGQAALATVNNFGIAGTSDNNFDQRVTSLALFDGNTQVGLAKAPDATTGKAQITNMNLLVPKGTSKTLTVKASFSSTASTTAPYDKVAVGIALPGDVTAQDQDSNTVDASLDTAVVAQATGGTPAVVITLLNSGALTIQADAHPATTIVPACKELLNDSCPWVPFAQYKATAEYEDVEIDRLALYSSSTAGYLSSNSDFRVVAVASNGAVKGQTSFETGVTKDVDLTAQGASKILVPKGGSVQFQIWSKLSNLVTSKTANGLWDGPARSGHGPALGLMASSTGSEWTASEYGYGTKLNIRSTGAASGERIYANTGAAHGNAQALRATYPIVSKQALSSTTLANTDMELLKFQVAANSSGSIAFKQAIFNVAVSGVTLANWKLMRGSDEVDPAQYTIVDSAGADLKAGNIAASDYVAVAFATGYEDGISGSGNVYTLRATVSGASSGDNVTIQFYRDPTTTLTTGYLGIGAVGVSTDATTTFGIDTSAAGDGVSERIGSFVWSDNSETPHSSALGNAGGSRDWTSDLLVKDLNIIQSLSLN
jgi:hypothetical protein